MVDKDEISFVLSQSANTKSRRKMEDTEKMEKKDEESSSEEDDIDAKETRCSPVKDYMIK